MEGKHIQFTFIFISGSLGEDADGNAVFRLINGSQNGLHTRFDILSVQKQTVQVFHPAGQKGNRLHFFFCNISGQIRAQDIGEKNVKETSVVSYVKDCRVMGDIFMADDLDIRPCNLKDTSENCLDNAQGADVLCPPVKFTDHPFNQQDRNG